MATTKKSTCVSTTTREELIERLVRGLKVPRRREDVKTDVAVTGIFLNGEEIDRRLGRYDSTWWPSAPSVEELAQKPVGTWVVPDGLSKTRCCRTKAEAMDALRATLLKLGGWGMAVIWRVSHVENPEYRSEADVEVQEFCCCFGDNEGKYPDNCCWLEPQRSYI